MKVKYTGSDENVQIAVTGQIVNPGDTIEVDNKLGKSLILQDIWEPVQTKKKET